MFDNNIPIPKVVVQPVLAGDRARSGGRAYRQGVDVCGRVLNVRRGRHRPRRYSPVPYGGVNRRLEPVQIIIPIYILAMPGLLALYVA